MSPDAIIAAGVRNRAARQAQIQRLEPRAVIAKAEVERLRELAEGFKPMRRSMETVERHRWVPGFFPTPKAVTDRMIKLANIQPGMRVLEPSCGKGDLAHAAAKASGVVLGIEIVPSLAAVCRAAGLNVICGDFLDNDPTWPIQDLDRIVMNPPFERRMDEAHVWHAFPFLRDGGRLVACVSSTTAARMRQWVEQRGIIIPLPAGSFLASDRSTGVNTALIVLDK